MFRSFGVARVVDPVEADPEDVGLSGADLVERVVGHFVVAPAVPVARQDGLGRAHAERKRLALDDHRRVGQ